MSSCPLPVPDGDRVLLAHGGGGRESRRLLQRHVGPALGCALDHDGAVLDVGGARIAMTTDSYVVRPLFFQGGDLGRLAVCGTVNDLAMCGARPVALSLALIAEEGLPLATLDRVLASVARTAAEVGVPVVTGDTKVVGRGQADGLYATTTGLGEVPPGVEIHPRRIAAGDVVLLSGDLGRHGVAVLLAREGLGLESALQSCCAPLHGAVAALLRAGIDVRCLRDPTRGGLAAALCELAASAGLDLEIDETALPICAEVHAVCEILGLDPMHLACEGRMVAVVPEAQADAALAALREVPVSAGAVRIGHVLARDEGRVVLTGSYGARRVLDLPAGELLPRIC